MKTLALIATMILPVLLILTMACQQTRPSSPPGPTPTAFVPEAPPPGLHREALPFTTVAQGATLGDRPQEPRLAIVRKEEELGVLTGLLPERILGPIRRGTDFKTSFLIAVVLGARPTSGYSVTITELVLERSTVGVVIAEKRPGPDQIVEMAFTVPYHLVRVSRSVLAPGDEVRFRLVTREGKPMNEVTPLDLRR